MNDKKRILVISMMTKFCQETIKYGISLAWQYEAELFIIHLAHNLHVGEERALPPGCSEKDFVDASVNAKATLDWTLRNVRVGGQHVKELFKEGDPVEEILKAIDDENIDILILPRPEESQPENYLFGRITEELVNRKPCQIIFVNKKPQGSGNK